MTKAIDQTADVLFDIVSVLGKHIRTNKLYWQKIKTEKHPEIDFSIENLKSTITDSDVVYRSQHTKNVYLYVKNIGHQSVVAVIRHLDGDGFVITSYQTTRPIKQREEMWHK